MLACNESLRFQKVMEMFYFSLHTLTRIQERPMVWTRRLLSSGAHFPRMRIMKTSWRPFYNVLRLFLVFLSHTFLISSEELPQKPLNHSTSFRLACDIHLSASHHGASNYNNEPSTTFPPPGTITTLLLSHISLSLSHHVSLLYVSGRRMVTCGYGRD